MRKTNHFENLKKDIYSTTSGCRSGYFSDSDWSNAFRVLKMIGNVVEDYNFKNGTEFEFVLGPSGYMTSSDGYSSWKEYRFEITDNDKIYYGVLNCCAAGTIEDKFSLYDMCLMM